MAAPASTHVPPPRCQVGARNEMPLGSFHSDQYDTRGRTFPSSPEWRPSYRRPIAVMKRPNSTADGSKCPAKGGYPVLPPAHAGSAPHTLKFTPMPRAAARRTIVSYTCHAPGG